MENTTIDRVLRYARRVLDNPERAREEAPPSASVLTPDMLIVESGMTEIDFDILARDLEDRYVLKESLGEGPAMLGRTFKELAALIDELVNEQASERPAFYVVRVPA